MNDYLQRYQVAVQHPSVSAFELLDMLMVRDKLAEQAHLLSRAEQLQLTAADQMLIMHAKEIVTELSNITDLAHEREQRQATQERWWWYLDVFAAAPLGSPSLHKLPNAA